MTTMAADVPAAFRRRGGIPDAYGWDDLAILLASAGGHHVAGTDFEWKHEYIPLTHAAAASHGHGKVSKGWTAPGGGSSAKQAKAPSLRSLAAKHGMRTMTDGQGGTMLLPKGGGIVSPVLREHGGHLRTVNGEDVNPGEADAFVAAYRQNPKAFSGGLLDQVRAGAPASAPASAGITQRDLTKIRKQTGLDMGHPDAYRLGTAKPDYAEALGHLAAGRNTEAQAAMDRMVTHAQAMKGPEGKRTSAAAVSMRDKVRAALSKPAVSAPSPKSGTVSTPNLTPAVDPEWKRTMDAMAAKEAAASVANARGMDRMQAHHDAARQYLRESAGIIIPFAQDFGLGLGHTDYSRAQNHLLNGQYGEAAAAIDRALSAERSRPGRMSKAQAARLGKLEKFRNQVTQAAAHPASTPPVLAKLPGTRQPDGSFTALDNNGNDHVISLKNGQVTVSRGGKTMSAPAGENPTMTARKLAAQLAGAALSVTWDDHARVIDLAVRSPAGSPGPQGVKSPPPAPRSRKAVPLTPMRREAAKSMRKLAASVQGSHPDMTVHDHLRDAARTLESGQEEASQRHLRAAMFALTPQSLMRNGLHTDDAHQAGRQVMHSVHRHVLLVKDITDVAARNEAAIRRLGGEDDTAPRPAADPNNGYGPGALAQKPTARQPGGDRALNAPSRSSSGGSDPAVADPDAPQKPGSRQFARTWGDFDALLEFSARTAMLESTPAPRGKPGGPGLYGVAGQEHEHYLQQVVKALIEKRGMPPAKAYAIAYGALRKWARGGGKVHGEVRAAAAGALAGEAAKAHGHAVTWDDISTDIRLSSVTDFAAVPSSAGGGPARPAPPPPASSSSGSGSPQARVPAGQAGGGRFGSGGGQATAGKQPAKPDAHQAHVAHLQHLAAVATQKAALMATAQDDRNKAAALIQQRNVLQKALASAGGKVSAGQAGAKTATTAKTKTTAPASTAKAATAAATTTAAKAPAAAKAATTAAPGTAAAKATAAQLTQQIGALTQQINGLLAAAKQATAQATALK